MKMKGHLLKVCKLYCEVSTVRCLCSFRDCHVLRTETLSEVYHRQYIPTFPGILPAHPAKEATRQHILSPVLITEASYSTKFSSCSNNEAICLSILSPVLNTEASYSTKLSSCSNTEAICLSILAIVLITEAIVSTIFPSCSNNEAIYLIIPSIVPNTETIMPVSFTGCLSLEGI